MKRKLFAYLLLTTNEREHLDSVYQKAKQKCDDSLSVWMTFALFGNLLPVIVVLLTNFALHGTHHWSLFVNNGNINLVGYSIIISTIFYLLDTTKRHHEHLKKKLLGVGIVFLFLNISMFTFQSTSILQVINADILVWSFVLSILILVFTTASGRYMVILQKEVVGSADDYDKDIKEKRNELTQTDNTTDVEY